MSILKISYSIRYVDENFQDWTYVFFPTMALLNKDLHSNDLDRAMIDILQQARQKGLEKSVGLYNHSDDNDAT